VTVVLQLLNSKCIPVLLYSLEACPLLTSDLSSVDVVIVRFLMKLFNIITWILSITIDNISLLNYLVLSGLIVPEGLRKSSPNVIIFFCKMSVSPIRYLIFIS